MSGKITLKTIFKMARDGGWNGSYNIENDLAFKLLKEEKNENLNISIIGLLLA